MEITPQAMAIPQETDHLPKGKYGPILPKTPACYGFSILAKIIPGREPVFHQYAKNIEAALKGQPPRATETALPALAVVSDQWRNLFHVSGYLRYRFRQVYGGCCGAV